MSNAAFIESRERKQRNRYAAELFGRLLFMYSSFHISKAAFI